MFCCYNLCCAGVAAEVGYLFVTPGTQGCGCGFEGCLNSTSLCVTKSPGTPGSLSGFMFGEKINSSFSAA